MRGGLLIIGLALLLGLLGSGLAHRVLTRGAEPPVGVERAPVVVAARDIEAGTPLLLADLRLVELPIDCRPPTSLADPAAVVGRVNLVPLMALEPVLPVRLSGPEGGVAAAVPPGQRATTILVDVVAGLAGNLRPGHRVDLLSTVDRSQEVVTRTVLEDVPILFVQQDDSRRPLERQTALTLLVDARQAEILATALYRGRVQLTLRHPTDHQVMAVQAWPDRPATADTVGAAARSRRRESRLDSVPPVWRAAPPTVPPDSGVDARID